MSAGAVARAPEHATPVSAGIVAAAAERLAAPSAVVGRTLGLLDDADIPLRRVADSVGESPELAVQTLRLACSAHYGRPAATLEEAVVRVGAVDLRGLLLAAETYPLMAGSLPVYGLPRLALVARATDIARVAHEVARRISPDVAQAAQVAGLLADIGMPILSDVATGALMEPPVPPVGPQDEERLFGTDHARVGAYVARRWGLGDELADAIAAHHDPDAPRDPVARAVWLAALVVAARGGDADAGARVGPALAECGLDEATATAIAVGGDPHLEPTRPPDLTDREVEVLRMVAGGQAAKQVAHRLGCSPSTVHNHLHHIYRKLDVNGQAQALLLARERGWV